MDDGVRFAPDSLQGREITVETADVGVRLSLTANLSGVVVRMQVDLGFGDVVVPTPTWIDASLLLDFGPPRVLGHPAAATLAEKLHAVVVLGFANSGL